MTNYSEEEYLHAQAMQMEAEQEHANDAAYAEHEAMLRDLDKPYQTGVWIEATEHVPFPRQSKEFLVRNDAQGGTLKLVYWHKVHSCFMSKGESIPRFFGTHFMIIPK